MPPFEQPFLYFYHNDHNFFVFQAHFGNVPFDPIWLHCKPSFLLAESCHWVCQFRTSEWNTSACKYQQFDARRQVNPAWAPHGSCFCRKLSKNLHHHVRDPHKKSLTPFFLFLLRFDMWQYSDLLCPLHPCLCCIDQSNVAEERTLCIWFPCSTSVLMTLVQLSYSLKQHRPICYPSNQQLSIHLMRLLGSLTLHV